MLRRVVIACAVLMAFASYSAVQAGIPIPCADTQYLKAPVVSGATPQGFILYYRVEGCSGSNWDAYYSADGKRLPIPQGVLSSLPPPPGFWASAWEYKTKFWREWFWVFFAPFVVLGGLLAKYAEVYGGDVAPPPGHPRALRRR
jgi:hypothetical protein